MIGGGKTKYQTLVSIDFEFGLVCLLLANIIQDR